MRSEKEMIDLILKFARNNEDVRAVVMNGSRVNPNVKKDLLQDYDIIYFVKDIESYRRNQNIVDTFGEIMILQTPEDMGDPPPQKNNGYGYLMQFMDGNRIDLGFYSTEAIPRCTKDSLTVVLLDKDGLIGELPPPSELDYLPRKPTSKSFEDCCNEFWWLNPYVAKGLWRDELTYAKYMLDTLMRGELMKMLVWYCGVKTDFQQSPGKFGKFLKNFLETELWELLERTYCDANPENVWESLFTMGDLFREISLPVARAFGFTYPLRDDRNVSNFIRHIKMLPKDAVTIW